MNLAPSSHHELGPSSWPIWAECPDFEAPSEDLEDLDVAALLTPEERGREDAKQMGTRLHKALAKVLTRQPDPFEGLSERERDQVQYCAEQIFDIAARHGYSQEEVKAEVRLTTFVGDSFEILYFGTCDVRIGNSIVVDAKFGDMRNYLPQLVGYLLSLMEEYGFSRGYAYTVYGRWRRTQQYVLDRDTVETIAYGILNKRRDPGRKPSPCQFCNWCAKRAACEAFVRPVASIIERREDWRLKLRTPHISQIGVDPVQAGLARWLWKYHLEPWGSAVEFLTASMEERGITPLGFKRQNYKGSKTVTNAAAAARVLEAAGVPREAIEPALGVSFGALVEVYRKAMKVTEKAAIAALEEMLGAAKVLEYSEAGFKLMKAPGGEDALRLALAQNVLPAALTDTATSPTSHLAP